MRIVTLACSNTEIVCALGAADMLVGVDNHSDYPEHVVSRLPRVGPDLQIDVEKVAALRPDLVIASLTVPGHERVVDALSHSGLPFVALEPVTLDDVYESIRTVARLLSVAERGERLIAEMRAELEWNDPEPERRPALLVEWWPKPVIVPGRSSWVNGVLRAAGARNPFELRDCKSTPIHDHEALAARPDAVVISWCGVRLEKYRTEVVYRRPSWQPLPALAERHVYAIAEAYLGRPGPRLVLGCRAIKQIVQKLQSSDRASASSI